MRGRCDAHGIRQRSPGERSSAGRNIWTHGGSGYGDPARHAPNALGGLPHLEGASSDPITAVAASTSRGRRDGRAIRFAARESRTSGDSTAVNGLRRMTNDRSRQDPLLPPRRQARAGHRRRARHRARGGVGAGGGRRACDARGAHQGRDRGGGGRDPRARRQGRGAGARRHRPRRHAGGDRGSASRSTSWSTMPAPTARSC